MPWFESRGIYQYARPGSQREARLAKRGRPVDEAEVLGESDISAAVEPEPKPVRKTVETVVGEATDADLATVERLLHEEYVGANRKTAIDQLERIRARKRSEE